MTDKIFFGDIFDRESIVDYALKYKITTMISAQNDLTMPIVAYVAEKLHLPENTAEQVLGYCNKSRFHEDCKPVGIPVPRNTTVSAPIIPENMKEISFPRIVKGTSINSFLREVPL